MESIYKIISYIGFSLAGVSAVLAVILFFKFNIVKLAGDLSGKTAKKSIEKMRSENEKSGSKSYRASPVAAERGTITDVMRDSQKFKASFEEKNNISKAKTSEYDADAKTSLGADPTTLLNDNATTILDSNPTDVLNNETTVLGKNPTTVLNDNNQTSQIQNSLPDETAGTTILENDATTVLSSSTDSNATTILENNATTVLVNDNNTDGFKLVRSVVQIHTNEVI